MAFRISFRTVRNWLDEGIELTPGTGSKIASASLRAAERLQGSKLESAATWISILTAFATFISTAWPAIMDLFTTTDDAA